MEKVSFAMSKVEPLAWHYGVVKVNIQESASVIEIGTQGESSQTVIIKSVGALRGIYYGSDKGNFSATQSVLVLS